MLKADLRLDLIGNLFYFLGDVLTVFMRLFHEIKTVKILGLKPLFDKSNAYGKGATDIF